LTKKEYAKQNTSIVSSVCYHELVVRLLAERSVLSLTTMIETPYGYYKAVLKSSMIKPQQIQCPTKFVVLSMFTVFVFLFLILCFEKFFCTFFFSLAKSQNDGFLPADTLTHSFTHGNYFYGTNN
jgi:hypothetical protein